MTEVSQEVSCHQCTLLLTELPNLPLEKRTACPNCGSFNRKFQVSLSSTTTLHATLSAKHRVPGIKKPVLELVSGDSLHRDSSIWMTLERIIDRGKNWYKETITNPKTGNVVHQNEEPLDQHVGHGSAKFANNKPPKNI